MHFSVIFRPPPLLVIERTFSALIILDANDLLQHKSKVDWLSNRSTFLRSKLVNFLDDSVSRVRIPTPVDHFTTACPKACARAKTINSALSVGSADREKP